MSKPSPDQVEEYCRNLDFRPEERPAQMLNDRGRVFTNPANGYEYRLNNAGLWAFLFGPMYFMAQGAWAAAIIYVVAILVSSPTVIGPVIVWIVGAIVAKTVVANTYLRRGWVEKKD